ncbi:type II secretion system F family protein [Alkaliphilus crotonatoxidans]
MGLQFILILIAIISFLIILYLMFPGRLQKLKEPALLRSKGEKPQNEMKDYSTYQMPFGERLIYIFQAMLILFLLGYVFYQHLLLSLVLTPLALYYPKIKRKEIIVSRKLQLNIEFKDALYAISSSLSAGKSMEASLRDAIRDLKLQYAGESTFIISELELIIGKLEMNETIESAFHDLASYSHLEDIQNFVDVFVTSNRAGGNLVEVMKNTSKIIAEKLEFKQDLELLLAQRKFEQRVLMVLPVLLIIVLKATAPDYMAPVFTTAVGRVVMTIALVLMGIALWLSKKIMNIEV